MPENKPLSHIFGGGVSESTIDPVVLVAMLIAILLIFVLPRRYVLVPVLCAIFLAPAGESVHAVGVHWFVSRIIVLAGLVRAVAGKPGAGKPLITDWLNSIDRAYIACVLCEAVAFTLLYRQTGALIYQCGFIIDALGAYLLLRMLLKDEADIELTLKWMGLIVACIAVCMMVEQMTLHNPFGLIGGKLVPDIREGRVRSQGPFHHALTAGTFAATLVPLFFLLWKNARARFIAILGLLGCTLMTICSQSSTPLLSYVASFIGVCFWPLRKSMRALRWGALVILIGLHLVMKAPVWFLIARVDLVDGSSAYHRALLVDQFIRHFGDWWLMGTKDAGSWGWDLWDVQNQYVEVGETGGLVALILFVLMITLACSRLGNARRMVTTKQQEWYFWFLGCALVSNLVAFFGVNYSDQLQVNWFILLAMIPAATAPVVKASSAPEPELEEQVFPLLQEPATASSPSAFV
jgi:hypothetical protein